MQKTITMNNIFRFLTVLLDIVLFISVILLMRYVQDLLDSDVKINLTEVVTQNKDVITSKLKVELNNLDYTAKQIEESMNQELNPDSAALKQVYYTYISNRKNDKVYIADKNGMAYFPDHSEVDISGRKYFKLALGGKQNITGRTVSRLSGDDIFVISVPVLYKNTIIGTIQKYYTPDEMYNICSISLFSAQGNMYVINSEGYILISSQSDRDMQESSNYYRILYAAGNVEASKRLETDIQNHISGFMETTMNGQRTFSAYTAIEEVHDWFLISSVATSAVSPNANIVIKIFYVVLSALVSIFGISILYFMSYKRKQQRHLENIAFVDDITKGKTFSRFALDLQEILNRNPTKQFYLLKFDIDNFKYVNNYYGFDFGDKVLKGISDTIEKQLRPLESVGHISSDHFVVLLENADADRLDQMLKPIQFKDGGRIYLSGGLYTITDPTESVNLMIDKASIASHQVKDMLLKQVVCYSDQLDQQIVHNELLKQSIELALTEGEMIPFYQPKVDVNTGRLVGAEALARWCKKDGSLVPPNDFIPLCEKTGIVVALDMAIFEQVLNFMRRMIDANVECVPISVNFSRLHLMDSCFLDQVAELMQHYQIPSNLIEMELTESVIFDNYEMITTFIKQLHERGILFSMDDFGSGYSSLNMLKNVPIDVLKIDKEFLKDTDDNQRRNIIFSSIAQMAARLHIKVVVEGVENIENVKLMKQFGCTIAQGYYYARPMKEKDFLKIYQEGFV